MAHAAKIDKDNVVENVIVIPDNLDETESDQAVQEYCESVGLTGKWIRTSYNRNIRYNFAVPGGTFDPNVGDMGAFIDIKPYNSWVLDTETYRWKPPIPSPDPERYYLWDEETLSWTAMFDD